ncbi:uncharacterized protein LOC131948122 [Physella acuta]|uniref:uncharacterized protein LOC131948122 n=1 Tax=Physella acuta TaxID=109671 RepID=UPI0027DC8756|nr:uncharacterized protein LOC131948122 [Physella acuta]
MAEEVAESYRSSLDDLKLNSKPQISMLTMLAEDHEQYASEIVRVIEEQIKKVPVTRKLPIMYLIDSIIKNLSSTVYPELFSQSIVRIFLGVFEEVDEKTRQSMYKLRQTWVDIIPNKYLYILDRKVQLIDPAWPITAKAPEHGVIHVNPKFLKPNKVEEERSPQFSPVNSESAHSDDAYKDELVRAKEELQTLRLQLELAETKAKLEMQKKQLEEKAILKSGFLHLDEKSLLKPSKKIINREPPPVIKLPPVGNSTTSGQSGSRDPRLNRDPRINRDPRLKKQMEKQEQERIETEKQRVEKETTPPVIQKPIVDVNKVASGHSGMRVAPVDAPKPTSPRLDLATLLTSFSEVAAKVAAENKKKISPPVNETQMAVDPRGPLEKKETKLKSNEHKIVQRETRDSSKDRKVDPKSKKELPVADKSKDSPLKSDKTSEQDKKREQSKDKSPAKKDKVDKEKKDREKGDSKDDIKKESSDKDKKDVKDRRDSKDIDKRENRDRRDSKDKDKRDSKDRRDSKDSERSRDKRDSRERHADSDVSRHSPRRNYNRRSPPDYRRNFRDTRPSRARGREKARLVEPVIHSSDGKTDQFGRMLRTSKSGSSSRDRSPIDREKERISCSPQTSDSKDNLSALVTEPRFQNDEAKVALQASIEKMEPVKDLEQPQKKDEGAESVLLKTTDEENLHLPEDTTKENPVTMNEQIDAQVISFKSEVIPPEELIKDSAPDLSCCTEDIDMRIQQPLPDISKKDSLEKAEIDETEGVFSEPGDSLNSRKRSNSETDNKIEIRPYKIPKLAASKKLEEKDISIFLFNSNLFGEEDVDLRIPKPVLAPPPMPVQNLLSPPASSLKSPAQRRWSQFKESHPDDFAQDIERKRLRDAQMQSIASEVQDVDLRMLPSRQRSLQMPPVDLSTPIPKDLIENQEQILQRAEQELKEGRISHVDHQEIVKQLGQVYDIQKKRHNLEERPFKSLDLRDPRLRGIREMRSYPDDLDRRGYRDDVAHHKKPLLPGLPLSGDMPDESANNSPRYRDRRDNYRGGYETSPKEDFDARRPRAGPRPDRRVGSEFNRRGPPLDYDGRSPRDIDLEDSTSPRDFDVRSRFRDFDGRPRRELDEFKDHSRDFDGRRPHDEEAHRDFRNADRRSFDEYDVSSNIRGPALREPRHDDLRDRRRNTPPIEGHYRGLSEEAQGPRPYGRSDEVQGPVPYVQTDESHNARPYGPSRHVIPQDLRGPRPNYPGPVMRPQGPRPNGPDGPRPLASPTLPNSRISDPMEDPRWSAMRGLLDHEGTEELVIDGKPFELRMGTSRKLRVYGKVMDVAVDLKERGIRIDNQLVYKLGEPIKEVHAVGRGVRLYYHGLPKPIWLDGQQHEMRMDAPPRNVMVDGVRRGFQIDGRDMMILVDRLEKGPYGGPPRKIRIAGIDHDIAFQAPPRRILIDNKSCDLKLDGKIPYVIIDGKPHGIRFDGEPRTVFINEQPFTIPVDRAEKIRIGSRPTYIAFGGPAHEIIIDGKWFEVKFDNVPKDIHLGNRHYTIRIPGPLPRVKILDELPQNVDESRLMSSNQIVPQSDAVSTPLACAPFPHGPGNALGPLPAHNIPGADNIQRAHITEGIPPAGPLITDGSRPANLQTSEGIMRPVGPITSDTFRFGQPSAQNLAQPNQPVMSTQVPSQMMQQSNPSMPGQLSNPLMGLQRPNLLGFGMNQQGLNRNQPVNLLAQGLLNQVATSMINNQFVGMQSLPDLAAGIRALTQLTASNVQPHMQSQMQPALQSLPKPLEDDHGAVMATGMQSSGFGPQKFGKPGLPIMPALNTQSQPSHSTIPGLSGLPGFSSTDSFSNPVSMAPTISSVTAPKPPIDINSLLDNLLKVGLIKDPTKSDSSNPPSSTDHSKPETAKKTTTEEPTKKKEFIPDLTDFATEKLKRVYKSVIEQLHEGIQCNTCAARFTMNDHEKYRAHLDWHFRQNKMEQEMVKVAKNRKWFYPITDWIQYEELEDTEEKSRSEIFEQMRPSDNKPAISTPISLRALEGKEVIKNPVATGVEGEDVCATCGDPFDQMWNEDTEEWILKNTIKVDGKTYHPVCYEDAQETPTPVITPSNNPLDIQLAGLEATQENPDPAEASITNIKEEPMDTSTEPSDLPQDEPLKTEVKMETAEDTETVVPKVELESVLPNTVSEASTHAESTLHSSNEERTLAPTLLSTITETFVREIIPVSHEDPMSPWEMDSNPTPELSRTPTPEPNPSFTPAPSLSCESINSLIHAQEPTISEDPIPSSLMQTHTDSPTVNQPEVEKLESSESSQSKVEVVPVVVQKLQNNGL